MARKIVSSAASVLESLKNGDTSVKITDVEHNWGSTPGLVAVTYEDCDEEQG